MIQIISDHIAASTSKKDFVKDETKSLALEDHRGGTAQSAGRRQQDESGHPRMLTRGQLRASIWRWSVREGRSTCSPTW